MQNTSYAECKFDTSARGKIRGTLELFEKNGELHIMGNLEGFGDKFEKHGFHIHTNGSVDDMCKAAGSHYNPFKVSYSKCIKNWLM